MTLRSQLLLAAAALTAAGSTGRADDWPQWMGPTRDAVWTETGILDQFPAGGPKELWRVAIGGGYAGPAVAGGRVYVADKKLKDGAKVTFEKASGIAVVDGKATVSAMFAAPGAYVLRATPNDGALATKADVTVVVQ